MHEFYALLMKKNAISGSIDEDGWEMKNITSSSSDSENVEVLELNWDDDSKEEEICENILDKENKQDNTDIVSENLYENVRESENKIVDMQENADDISDHLYEKKQEDKNEIMHTQDNEEIVSENLYENLQESENEIIDIQDKTDTISDTVYKNEVRPIHENVDNKSSYMFEDKHEREDEMVTTQDNNNENIDENENNVHVLEEHESLKNEITGEMNVYIGDYDSEKYVNEIEEDAIENNNTQNEMKKDKPEETIVDDDEVNKTNAYCTREDSDNIQKKQDDNTNEDENIDNIHDKIQSDITSEDMQITIKTNQFDADIVGDENKPQIINNDMHDEMIIKDDEPQKSCEDKDVEVCDETKKNNMKETVANDEIEHNEFDNELEDFCCSFDEAQDEFFIAPTLDNSITQQKINEIQQEIISSEDEYEEKHIEYSNEKDAPLTEEEKNIVHSKDTNNKIEDTNHNVICKESEDKMQNNSITNENNALQNKCDDTKQQKVYDKSETCINKIEDELWSSESIEDNEIYKIIQSKTVDTQENEMINENGETHENEEMYGNDTTHENEMINENGETHENEEMYVNGTTHENEATYNNDTTHENEATYNNDTTHENEATYNNYITHENNTTYNNDTTHENNITHKNSTVISEIAGIDTNKDAITKDKTNNDTYTNSVKFNTKENKNAHVKNNKPTNILQPFATKKQEKQNTTKKHSNKVSKILCYTKKIAHFYTIKQKRVDYKTKQENEIYKNRFDYYKIPDSKHVENEKEKEVEKLIKMNDSDFMNMVNTKIKIDAQIKVCKNNHTTSIDDIKTKKDTLDNNLINNPCYDTTLINDFFINTSYAIQKSIKTNNWTFALLFSSFDPVFRENTLLSFLETHFENETILFFLLKFNIFKIKYFSDIEKNWKKYILMIIQQRKQSTYNTDENTKSDDGHSNDSFVCFVNNLLLLISKNSMLDALYSYIILKRYFGYDFDAQIFINNKFCIEMLFLFDEKYERIKNLDSLLFLYLLNVKDTKMYDKYKSRMRNEYVNYFDGKEKSSKGWKFSGLRKVVDIGINKIIGIENDKKYEKIKDDIKIVEQENVTEKEMVTEKLIEKAIEKANDIEMEGNHVSNTVKPKIRFYSTKKTEETIIKNDSVTNSINNNITNVNTPALQKNIFENNAITKTSILDDVNKENTFYKQKHTQSFADFFTFNNDIMKSNNSVFNSDTLNVIESCKDDIDLVSSVDSAKKKDNEESKEEKGSFFSRLFGMKKKVYKTKNESDASFVYDEATKKWVNKNENEKSKFKVSEIKKEKILPKINTETSKEISKESATRNSLSGRYAGYKRNVNENVLEDLIPGIKKEVEKRVNVKIMVDK